MKKIILLSILLGLSLMLQAQISKTISITAGGLSSSLSINELATITNLTIDGTIDARDFKILRDDMSLLADINLSGVNIVGYTGNDGTNIVGGSFAYPANEIPIRAFNSKHTLKTILLPLTTKTIGEFSFVACDNITEMVIPNGVTTILSGAFYASCKNSTLVTIPSGVSSIANDAFIFCSATLNVDVANQTYSSTDGVLFNKNQSLLIHYPILKTGTYTIPSTVITIGVRAFCGCSQLTGITIPSSVNEIEATAFEGCSNLTTLDIPEGVKIIKDAAFAECNNVSKISFPSSLKMIGENAFNNLVKLASITLASPIPVNLSPIKEAFTNVNKTSCVLNVPFGTSEAYRLAIQWGNFTNIVEMNGVFLSAYTVNFDVFGGIRKLKIVSNETWNATSSQSWLTLSPANGINDGTLTFMATINPTPTLSRNATVTITTSGGLTKEIEVIQAKESSVLTITSGSVLFAKEPVESETVEVFSNAEWTISPTESWLTITPSSGSGNGAITLAASANPNQSGRTGTVTITYPESYSKKIFITQSGELPNINVPGSVVKEKVDPFLANPAEGFVKEVPVVIIRYLPTLDGVNIDVLRASDFWEPGEKTLDAIKSDMDTYDKRVKFSLEEGSKYHGYKDSTATPYLGYRIVACFTVYDQVPISKEIMGGTIGGIVIPCPDMFKVCEQFDIKDFVEKQGVKEIWMWGGTGPDPNFPIYDPKIHKIENMWGAAESTMSSKLTQNVSNGGKLNDQPIYSKSFTTYWYNIRRSQAEGVHIHGHQLECLLSYANGRQDGNSKLFWQDFVGRDSNGSFPIGRVGDTHQPPNTINDYDYGNLTLVESDCEDWKPAGGTKKLVNVNTWGDIKYNWPGESDFGQRKESQFYLYWKQNMPGKDNQIPYFDNKKTMTNWWDFTADWDSCYNNMIGLYSSKPIPYLKINSDSWNLCSSEGSAKTLKIKSNTKWAVFFNQDWLVSNNQAGTGDGSVTLTAKENSGSDSRTATISISTEDGTLIRNYILKQQAKEELATSKNVAELDAFGHQAFVHVTSNANWKATSDQAWLIIKQDSVVKGNRALTFFATGNPYTTVRTAIITITTNCSAISKTITVTQQPGVSIEITAGGLRDQLSAQLTTIETLILSGTIDARDFKTMREAMPRLKQLNLQDVHIVRYVGTEGTHYLPGDIDYPADEIPVRALYWNRSIKSILLPLSAKVIGYFSLGECLSLETVNIPQGITTIIVGAFSKSEKISTIYIPSSVVLIENAAFGLCSASIVVDSSNLNYSSADGVLFNKDKSVLIHYPKRRYGNYTVPSTVTTIVSRSFNGCNQLLGINFPTSLKKIEIVAFESCEEITSLKIPEGVETIGESAFSGCVRIISLALPKSLKSIDNHAFSNLISLTGITVSNPTPINLANSPNVFLNVKKSTCTLYVPYGSKSAYRTADQWKDFTNMVEMAEFKLSANAVGLAATAGAISVDLTTSLSWTVSSDQTWLTITPASGTGNQTFTLTATANSSLSIRTAIVTVSANDVPSQIITVTQDGEPQTLAVTAGGLLSSFTADELSAVINLVLAGTIDARDFKTMRDNMPLLAKVDLSAVTIAAYTGTEGTAGSSNVVYPANGVPSNAFVNNITWQAKTSLTSLILPTSVTSIGNYAFYSCIGLLAINIPSSVTSIGSMVFYRCKASFTVDPANSNYSAIDGVLFNNAQKVLIQCPTSKTGFYAIPSSVTSLGNYSFAACSNLATVGMPSSITSLGTCAFQNCIGLTALTIPQSVTSIGGYAFQNCYGLTTIAIPSLVTSIGSGAFSGCSNLSSIYSNSITPQNLSSSVNVFNYVDKTTCKLYVPSGSTALYAAANQWKDFINILEIPELKVSATTAGILAAEGNTATVDVTSNVSWTASSDQTWLLVSPASGTGDQTLTFTAGANLTFASRLATVTVYSVGLESKILSVTQQGIYETQTITLNVGWNIISVNVVPVNLNLKDLFQSLIDAGKLKKVMDEAGKTIENFGAFGGWKNNIGNMNSAKGYKVNVLSTSTLSLEGTPVPLPLDIALATGWNIISYPSATAQDAKALVQSLIDTGKLKKVMDEAGKTIENFGAFGGWKNNIGNLLPGKGYKVNVLENCTLTIPANGTKAATIVPEVLASTHFTKVFIGNGTDHASINLVNLQASGLLAGDEIGVFDGEHCVGSATIGAVQLMTGSISIPASANDEMGESINGFTSGHPVELQLYRGTQIYKLKLEKLGGSEWFEKNESLFVQANTSNLTAIQIADNSAQFKCFPNPFTNEITIEVQNSSRIEITVEIYNMAGQRIKNLFKGTNFGTLVLKWNGTNDSGQQVVPGVYLCKVNGQSKQVIFEGEKGKK